MENWKKFANTLEITKDIEETYFKIRQIFQREGWMQHDLEKPPYYPKDLMTLFQKFSTQRSDVFQIIRDYGFNVDHLGLTGYIQDKLSLIDNITPLIKKNTNGN
jgi:hypothetical protein